MLTFLHHCETQSLSSGGGSRASVARSGGPGDTFPSAARPGRIGGRLEWFTIAYDIHHEPALASRAVLDMESECDVDMAELEEILG